MFELAFIKKYLTPKRGQLSVSLIATLSVLVIALVVWLVTLFLSVTEGVERNWIGKLTALNAPVRITPTPKYYRSYYYQADQYSHASSYQTKTLGQKLASIRSDPYDLTEDQALPAHIPLPYLTEDGNLVDPVKTLGNILDQMQVAYQDVEASGALLRLNLVRDLEHGKQAQSQLTSVSFLSSFAQNNPKLSDLILPPLPKEIDHLLFLAKEDHENIQTNIDLVSVVTKGVIWSLPYAMLPENTPFAAECYFHDQTINHLILAKEAGALKTNFVIKKNDSLVYVDSDQNQIPLDLTTPLFASGPTQFEVQTWVDPGTLFVKGQIQGASFEGNLPLSTLRTDQIKLKKMQAKNTPWAYENFDEKGKLYLPSSDGHQGVLLAKSFQDNGVLLGDRGSFAYSSPSLRGTGEGTIPIYVAGFYDPGVMPTGNRCVLVPQAITTTIQKSQGNFALEQEEANSFFVWPHQEQNISKNALELKQKLLSKLYDAKIDDYFMVQTYHDYEFSKGLLQQFQSDKYLFTLIGAIILLVACTNIISLLILLVSDKRKEIGILRAMGTSRKSICAIFALSGGILGTVGCILGLLLAHFTLMHIDQLVGFLSLIQGHQALNPQFFGHILPNQMSQRALVFASIATPLLALLAGLVPALKAAKIQASSALRSE